MENPSFNKIVIFYFSGTGNAKSVAGWIKQTAELNNVETELVDIAKLDTRKVKPLPKNVLIGFCSPTHGFNFPPIMLNFIFRFPKANQNNLFLVNTRAGLKLGKLFIPGLSGIALLLSSLVLKLKGYKIIGMRSIDLPSNWLSLHPALWPTTVESIFNKRKKEVGQFILTLLKGKKVFRALRDIIQDLLISPIAVLYYFIGRFILAKSFIASHDCNNCNLCVEQCPVNAIKIIDERCYWSYKCESCMHCMNVCPSRAIETAHGFVIGIGYIINALILVWIYRLLNLEYYFDLYLTSGVSWFVSLALNSIVYIGLCILAYRLMHFSLRFRFFERLIVFTSLTKYKFWGRYKPSKKLQS